MRTRALPLLAVLAVVLASCASVFQFGRDFPSPKPGAEIKNGVTTKADLLQMFGEPAQTGVKDGDQTWTWYYGKKGTGKEPDRSKQLDVTFDEGGVEVVLLLLELPGGHEDPLTRRAGSPPGGPRAGGVLPVLLLVVLLWGGSYPAIKATQAFFPPVGLAAFRTAAAAGILAGVGLLRGGLRLALPRADWVRLAAAGVAGNTAFHLLLVTGVHRTTAAHAAILVNLSPIVAALLARTVNREPLGGRRAAGLAMALAGVAVVVGGRDGAGAAAGRLGDLLCLGASVAWALFTALGKPVLARGSPRLVTTWATLLGAVPLLPLGAAEIAAVRWSALGPGEWLLLGYLSAGTIAAGNLLWYWALERAATARVVSFTYLIPLVGAGLAVALGQERPSLALVAGGLATVAGVALAQGAGRAGEAA